MVQGQEKSIRFSHETYLQHCSPQRKNTEEEEESAEKLNKEQPQGLEIDIPLVEIQCHCHLLSPTLKNGFFSQYIFSLYTLKQMLHPTSSLVISWVILKLAKNQFPHTLSNYSINMFSDTLGVSVVF